jgi:hypothetical protein
MATINEIVSVQVTRATRTPSRVGFGTPILVGWTNAFPEQVKSYTDPADFLEDGVPATDPLYLAAVALMSQSPRPPRFLVGRRNSTAPTQAIALDTLTTTEGATVGITIGGQRAEYTVQSGDVKNDVLTGLTAAINALTVAATAVADTVTDFQVDVSSDVAGTFFAYENPVGCVVKADDTPSEAIATDLTAIRQSNDDWYCLIHPQSSSKAQTLDIAAQVESLIKVFSAQSADFEVLDSEEDQDVFSQLQAQGYDRTFYLWHQEVGSGGAAGWAGKQLPKEAGRTTWAHKDIAGLLTTPQHVGGRDVYAVVPDKHGNYMTTTAGLRLTFDGTVAGGEYIDIIRGTDQLIRRMKERLLAVKANAEKVDYTDDGIESLVSQVEAELAEGETPKQGVRFLQPGSSTVTAPAEADVAQADKASRTLRDVEFVSRYAGAIQKTEIRGRISL